MTDFKQIAEDLSKLSVDAPTTAHEIIDSAVASLIEAADLLATATSFEINRDKFTGGVTVERRQQLSGPDRWAVVDGRAVLNTDGEWEYEPLPSNRTDEFLLRTRFSLEEALKLGRAVAWEKTSD